MKLLQPNTTSKSYTLPVIKVCISLSIMAVLFFRDKIFGFTGFFQYFFTIVSAILSMICILCIYASVAEMYFVYNNRKSDSLLNSMPKTLGGKPRSLNEIMSLINQNDIIDIVIISNDRIVRIGSSSDYNNFSGLFFDKRYYIDKTEYIQIRDFESELESFSHNGILWVHSIDSIVIN